MKQPIIVLAFAAIIFGFGSLAHADIAQMKIYKEVYPDSKPKCISCHSSALPKKDGEHELNDYGKKVKSLAEKPTAEDYKKAGSAEEVKK